MPPFIGLACTRSFHPVHALFRIYTEDQSDRHLIAVCQLHNHIRDLARVALGTHFVALQQLQDRADRCFILPQKFRRLLSCAPCPIGPNAARLQSAYLDAERCDASAQGGAQVVGDFNGDGLPDLVFASSRQTTPTQVGVMFGTPRGTFQSPIGYPVGPIPGLPVLADLNGDGILDMVVANAGFSGNLSVLIGNGDGTFQTAVSSVIPPRFGASSVAVGDFNGDGKPDIAVGNGTAGNILVFPGNGDGTFRAPVGSFNIIGAVVYLAAGDFNKDGKLDLAVMGTVGVQIALGNGDGTFHGSLSLGPPGAFGAIGPLAVADLNGDGNPDLVYTASNTTGTAATLQPGNIWVMLGHGDGTFGAAVTYSIGKVATGVAIGDLNGDGKPDLAVADYAPGAADVAVLLGNGDGTFQAAVKYPAVNGAGSVVMADFNGDGYQDLAVVSNSSGANSSAGAAGAVTVLLGQGDGTFRDAIVYGAGINPPWLAAGDVSGDGQPDLLFTDDLANTVLVLLNNYIPGSSGSACTAVQPLVN